MALRILQLTQRFPPAIGGVETHVFNISNLLAGRGYKVVVLTSDLLKDKPFIRLFNREKTISSANGRLKIRRLKALKLFNLKYGTGIIIPQMLREALFEKADIVHAHAFGFWPTYVGMIKKIRNNSFFVITPHSNPGSRDYGNMDVRKCPLKIADRIIALTGLEKKHLISLGIDSNKICVIPNGIDLSSFEGVVSSKEATNTVLYVGRIDCQHKGLDTLIRAIPKVLGKIPDAKFVLVSPDWGDQNYLEKLASQLHVRDKILFTGFLSHREKLRYYSIADICVLPSNIEPFGIVALEAMACGKPIVASCVGGIPEIINNEKNGLLVPPKNAELLAEALINLLQDYTTSRKMGSSGRAMVKAYTWPSAVNKLEAIYKEAQH